MKKRVLLISYHFYPDRAVGAKRPTQLAESLQNEGWTVETITRKLTPPEEVERRSTERFGTIYPLYQHPGIVDPLWQKIKASRKHASDDEYPVASASEIKNRDCSEDTETSESLLQKSKRYLFSIQALLDANKSWLLLSFLYLVYLRLRGQKYDLVISSSPPASVHLVGFLTKILFGCRWVADLRDPLNLWHEVAPGSTSIMREKLEAWLERIYYRYSDALVVTTNPLKDQISEDVPEISSKVHLIYNGYDGVRVEKRPRINGEVKMVFAGSLYMNRNPFPLFEAIKKLRKNTDDISQGVRLDLYGDCQFWDGQDLNKWITKNGLEGIIHIHSFVDSQRLEKILSGAHVLINFAQNQPLQIPAKTFEYLKYPAISMAITETDSAVSRLMLDQNLGVSSENDQEKLLNGIRLAVRKFNERNESGHDLEKFSRNYQNSKYIRLAANLSSTPRDSACGS